MPTSVEPLMSLVQPLSQLTLPTRSMNPLQSFAARVLCQISAVVTASNGPSGPIALVFPDDLSWSVDGILLLLRWRGLELLSWLGVLVGLVMRCASLILGPDVFIHSTDCLVLLILLVFLFNRSDYSLLVLLFWNLPPWTLRGGTLICLALTVGPVIVFVSCVRWNALVRAYQPVLRLSRIAFIGCKLSLFARIHRIMNSLLGLSLFQWILAWRILK